MANVNCSSTPTKRICHPVKSCQYFKKNRNFNFDFTFQEDDAFQLARYIEQSLNESRYTSSVNTTATQLPEQPSNDNGASKPLDQWNDCSQPLDLSVKQTPMSTDTGFCNDSFLLDATPPYRCCGTDGAEPVYANHIANNWNVDTNAWMNGSRKYAEMENTSRLHGNVNILSPAPSMSSVM